MFDNMINDFPILCENVGIKTVIVGPEGFSEDGRHYLGKLPYYTNLWTISGMSSIGINLAGGAGLVLSEWIHNGSPPFDITNVDVRRTPDCYMADNFIKSRCEETLGRFFEIPWPKWENVYGRNVKKLHLYEVWKRYNAVFGQAYGWERVN